MHICNSFIHTRLSCSSCMHVNHEDTTHLLPIPADSNLNEEDTAPVVGEKTDVIPTNHTSVMYNISICCIFTLSSMCMILLNKEIMVVLNYASLTLVLQNIGLLAMLKIWQWDLTFDYAKSLQWFSCSCLFFCNIFTSMQSLLFLSVPTFTVVRTLIIVFTFILDMAVRGARLSPTSTLFLSVIFGGVCVYHMDKWQSDFTGLCWAFAHVLSNTMYAVLVKIKIQALGFSASEMSLYNGLWSTLLLIPLVIYQGFTLVSPIDSMFASCIGKLECWGSLTASALCCCAVSVSGFIAHDIMSPVSFITFNNINKLPATALSYVIWPTQVSNIELFGMAASLWGGYFYALSTQTKHMHWIWICTSIMVLIGCISVLCVAIFKN